MYCKVCRIKMKEEKRPHHKQRKWICPRCKRVRFQKKVVRRGPSPK